jgi:hypothetical protein
MTTTDNEIRTLQLEFLDPIAAARFNKFCQKHCYSVLWYENANFRKASIVFQNKADRSRFLKAWRKLN